MDEPMTLSLRLDDEQAWQLSIMCKRLLEGEATALDALCGARRGAKEELAAAVTQLLRALAAKGYLPG